MDAQTQAKIDAVKGYLRPFGFDDLETDPPESLRHVDFYTIRATVAPGDYRLLRLKKSWLQGKTAEEVVRLIDRKGVVPSLQTDFREMSIVDDENTGGVVL